MKKNTRGILFKDREEVAKQLLDILPLSEMKKKNWSIIALSAGGFKIAYELAKKTKLDVDLLFNEAICAPANAECEIARVSETEEIVIHEILTDSFGIQNDYIFGEAKRQYEDKILPKIYRYRKDSAFCLMENRHVLLLDEGCETGLKMMVGIKSALKRHAKAIYVVSPVMPTNIANTIRQLVDDVYAIHEVDDYLLTSSYYDEFMPISDETMKSMFEKKKEKDEK